MKTLAIAGIAAVLSLFVSDVSFGENIPYRCGRPRGNPDGTDLRRLQFNNPDAVVPLHHAVFGGFFVQDWDKDGQPDICTYCWPSERDWCWCGVKMYSSSKAVSGTGADRVYPKGEWLKSLPPRDGIRGPGYWPAGKPFDLRNQSIHRPKGKECGYGGVDSSSVRGDLNGDGFDDLLVFCNDRTAYGWHDNFNEKGVWLNPHHCFGYVMWGKRHTKESPTDYRDPVALTGLNGQQMLFSGGVCCSVLEDFDGDGDLDLLTIEAPDLFLYRENLGSKTAPLFALPRDLVDAAGRRISTRLCFGMFTLSDYDGDGRKDLLAMDEESTVCWFRRTGSKDGLPVYDQPKDLMQQADELYFGDMSTPYAVDIDGDGDEDIVTGNAAGEIAIIENLSGKGVEFPKWAAPKKITTPDGKEFRITAGVNGSIQGPQEAKYGYTITTAADWDGDGLIDILFNTIWGKILWMRNIGTKTAPRFDFPRGIEVEWKGDQPELPWGWFKPKTQENPKEIITQWRTTPVPVDWNGDGLMDLILCDTDGDFALWERVRDTATGALRLLPPKKALCDLDGKPIRASRLVAKGEWLDGRAGASGRRKVAVLDWNGDGRLDLVMNFAENMQVYLQEKSARGKWYFRKVQGTLTKEPLWSHDPVPGACDFNGDGYPDLLFGAMDGYIYYLRNPLTDAKVKVLLPPDASLSQKTAATELRDYCRKMGVASGTIELKTDESLGESGYALETVGDRLVISGSRARGCLNGAYGYLQDTCGVEWFSSWCEQVSKRDTLPVVAKRETHKPAFEVRCSFWQDIMMHPQLVARLRLNSNIWHPRDDRFGPDLHKIDTLFEGAHSTRRILPEDKLFKDHPEWYSEINGKRLAKGGQPCLTNEELFQYVKARLIERVKACPDNQYYGFGLRDYYNDCTCAKCRAVNAEEGTDGGTYWRFVVRLAAVLKEIAPAAFIKASVYQQTSTPPKTVRIPKNVILDWAPIEAVRDEPIAVARHERSTKCMRELRGFQKIHEGPFMVWDYTTDFAGYCLPFANLPTLQPNLKLFREIGTYYMFEQGNHGGWHGDFDALKGWLLAQWMWNPDLDEKSLYTRFLNGYYGPSAAPFVLRYIRLLEQTIRESPKESSVGIWNLPSHRPEYFEDKFLVKAAELWDAAEKAVKDDPAKSYNVRMGALPVRYLQCLKYAKTVNLTSDPKALEKGRAYAKQFVALLDEAAAANHPVDFGETDHTGLLKRIRAFAGGAPVVGDGNRARLGSSAFLTTCAGTLCRREKSSEGYDGDLMHLMNCHYGWFPQASLDMVAFDPDAEYTLRLRVKVKATGKEGELFSAGICDTTAKKEYKGHVYPKDLKNGGDWAWYDIATWKPGVGHMSYVFAAAGWFDKKKYALSPAHEGVWIDGFEIVRKGTK